MTEAVFNDISYILLSQETMNDFDKSINYLDNVNLSQYIPRGNIYVITKHPFQEKVEIININQITEIKVDGDPEEIVRIRYTRR